MEMNDGSSRHIRFPFKERRYTPTVETRPAWEHGLFSMPELLGRNCFWFDQKSTHLPTPHAAVVTVGAIKHRSTKRNCPGTQQCCLS